MNDEAFLAGLKPGDEVSVGNIHIDKVKHVTPTQIVVGYTRYNRKTGRSCGERGFQTTWLYPVSQQLRDKVTRSAAIQTLRHTDTSKVPTATLVMMVNLMNAALGELQP